MCLLLLIAISAWSIDISPPSPDPMSFASNPTATSSTTIAMTATEASHHSGVEYYFTCTTDAAFSSGWQFHRTYVATGLSPLTTYNFTVKARDLTPNQNETAASASRSATTLAGDDPTNLALNKPAAQSSQWTSWGPERGNDDNLTTYQHTLKTDEPWWEVDLQANFKIASMTIKPRNNYFQRAAEVYLLISQNPFTQANLNDARNDPAVIEAHYQGTVSGDYTVNLANPVARYVRVWMNKNEYLNFAECVVMGTPADGDITPPSPNPMTFATNPTVVSSSEISMTATTASDPSGVEYLFTCTNLTQYSSSWQDSTSYTATGLQSGTYVFTVKARDKSPHHNETGASATEVAVIYPANYPPISGNSTHEHIARIELGSIDNSSGAETDGYGDYTNLSTSIEAGDSVGFTLTPGYASNPYNDGWGIWIDLNNDKDFTDAGEQVFVTWSVSSNAVSGTLTIPADTVPTTTRMRIVMTYNATPTSASGDIGNGEAEDYTVVITESDTIPPSPDPMTFASNPTSTGTTTITMTATTASDPSGVEYNFSCTNGPHFSGWQDETTYVATGLSPETTYSFTVRARDKSANKNETGVSVVRSATTDVDTEPPIPNPAAFATPPTAASHSIVSMIAFHTIDPSGVEYYFTCTSHAGLDSGWQNKSSYFVTDLTPETTYSFTVKTRDKSPQQNETGVSAVHSVTTDVGPINDAVFVQQDSSTQGNWKDVYGHNGYAIVADTTSYPTYAQVSVSGQSTYTWTSSTTDVRGLEKAASTDRLAACWYNGATYTIDVYLTDGLPHQVALYSVDWDNRGRSQTYEFRDAYTDALLDTQSISNFADGTWMVWTVTGHVKIILINDGSHNAVVSGIFFGPGGVDTTPPTPNPMTFATNPMATSTSAITMTATTASDENGVEYFFTCTTNSMFDSSWQYSTIYTATGLSANTTYSFTVKARDKSPNQNETQPSAELSASTEPSPPVPNPMTFAVNPTATSSTTVTMTATTATDIDGVEYYFTCTTDSAFNSAWQDSTTYVASGLAPSTSYGFTVSARDKSMYQSQTAPSAVQYATTHTPLPDTIPPDPDPMTFAVNPHATSNTSISMTAATATDVSGVEYYFTCTNHTGFDSGWQDYPTYVATGLQGNMTYDFHVKARDKSPNQNETNVSVTQSATTDGPDVTPPSPNPMTFAVEPAATSDSTIIMTATTASDPSGVEYYFTCTTNATFDSGWQDSTSYTATGLNPETTYGFTVKARDKTFYQSETAASAVQSATTHEPQPDTIPPSPNPMTFAVNPTAINDSTITMTATTASDVSGVEYFFTCTNNNAFNSEWQDDVTYEATGLSASTTYSFNVKARDKSSNQNETGASAVRSATTDPGTWPSPISGNTQYEHIARVQLGSIDNSSGDDDGYGDYTSQSTTIAAGDSVGFTLTPGFAGSAYNEGWSIWVDLNHDGDFTDSGEHLFVTSSQSSSAISGSITIPAGTAPVTTCMRIVMVYNSNPSSSSGDIGDGEAEDYTIVITSGAPDTIPPTPDPMTFASNPTATGSTTITMVATTASDPSGVEYFFTCTNAPEFSSVWQHSTTYVVNGLYTGTTYSFTVKARDESPNQNETAASAVQSATTHAEDTTPPTPDPMTFASNPTATSSSAITMTATTASDPSGVEYFFTCTTNSAFNSAWQDSTSYTATDLSADTTYGFTVKARDKSDNHNETQSSAEVSATTEACCSTYPTISGSTTYEHIAQVQLGSIDNSSGDDGGYGDYTAQSTSIAAGGSASFTLTPGYAGSSYNEGWSIWIDLNHDGDFTDSGEQVFVTSSQSSSAVTGSITIPAGTAATTTRMRIVMEYNTNPSSSTGDIGDGEAEDYTIVITP